MFIQLVAFGAEKIHVTIIKRLMDTVHDRSDGPDPDVFDALPAGAGWTVVATIRDGSSGAAPEVGGVLAHNGDSLSFVAWDGQRIFTQPLNEIRTTAISGDTLKLYIGDSHVLISQIGPLDSVLEHAPISSAEFRENDPFAGLLSWLPTLI